MRKKFTLWHSLVGMAALVALEWVGLLVVRGTMVDFGFLLLAAVVGAVGNLYVATEIVEEVRGLGHLFALLSTVTAEFIVFFAFQFYFLLMLMPQSYPTLQPQAVSLVLASTMVFVFNPLYLPATDAGRLLLLVETLSALGLVLFILQNITQLRRGH
jgi:hypothetical protein